MTHGTNPILFATAERRGRQFVERWRGKRPMFCCVLAHTDTCLIPGISMAGATEALRAYTPAADAEVVLLGRPVCLPTLPVNPLGPPGPAAITRAAVRLGSIPIELLGVGLRVWPLCPLTVLESEPGGDISLGRSVPAARRLFADGEAMGRRLAATTDYLVIGESVPGGTTTALAVLTALGYAARGRVSGSGPGSAHARKEVVVSTALAAAGLAPGDGLGDPLAAVAAVGDPMQPCVAGLLQGAASAGLDVLLAGGSQMVAVAALAAALDGPGVLDRAAIGTTRWIVQDPSADVPGLVRDVRPDLPLLAANLDFSASRHPPLRMYEQSLVKEGVGAGGACIAALLATGTSIGTLHAAIDEAYALFLAADSIPQPAAQAAHSVESRGPLETVTKEY